MEIPEYSKEIYPAKMPERKIKVGVLKEGVESCDENVRRVFEKAVQKLKETNDDVIISDVSLPEHATGSMAFVPFIFLGGFNSMIHGCGFGTSISGNVFGKEIFFLTGAKVVWRSVFFFTLGLPLPN